MGTRFASSLHRFRANRSGSPALEFAFVAPLFLLVLFSIFELGRALYDKNRIAAASSVGSRTLVLDSAATDTDIQNAVKAALSNYDVTKLTITLTTEAIAGQNFKKIVVSYDHVLIVNFGSYFSTFTLVSTRYAPLT